MDFYFVFFLCKACLFLCIRRNKKPPPKSLLNSQQYKFNLVVSHAFLPLQKLFITIIYIAILKLRWMKVSRDLVLLVLANCIHVSSSTEPNMLKSNLKDKSQIPQKH